jgi:aspartate racemase
MNKNINKTIGIIGGVGPQASHYLYGKVMQLAQSKYGAKNNDDFPQLVLASVPVPDFISNKKAIPAALKMFAKAIDDFNRIRVDYLVIASNTVHLLLPKFEKISKVPFISMIESVINKVVEDQRKIVGVLGSPMTKRHGLYRNLLSEKDIQIVYPQDEEEKHVEQMIRAVMAGTNNGSLKKDYIEVLNNLFNQGAEAIILACTELPLAINYEAIKTKVYNSMDILAEKLVDLYYD